MRAMKGLKRAFVAMAFALVPALAGGYFALGYQSAGGLEFGGGGYGTAGRYVFGGEGYGGVSGYGYGLGFFGYRVLEGEEAGVRYRLVPRLGLGGGGGRGWGGFLVEPGLWLNVEAGRFAAGLVFAYQYAPGHQGVVLRLTFGGGR